MLDQISQKPMITSLDLSPTIDEVSKAIKQISSKYSLGWTGFLQRSSSQPAQCPSKHSTRSSPASGKKRMRPKNPGMQHSSPCSRTGAVSLTTATTGASLCCPWLGRSWLGSSSTASSPASWRKTYRKLSVDSVQTAA